MNIQTIKPILHRVEDFKNIFLITFDFASLCYNLNIQQSTQLHCINILSLFSLIQLFV